MINRSISKYLALCVGLILAKAPSNACDSGSGSTSITPLSGPSGATFQVAGLNSQGQLTGYFFGNNPAHGFLYQNGVL